ncbi:MAG: TonB-dependent receptor [Arcicella sp.]|nr:TonB-dependent receptor [Arcicella sp.]
MNRILTQKIWLILVLTLINFSIFAQSTKVTGKVVDVKGASLVGVSVAIKGTSKGTTTDGSGNYAIEVSSNQTLSFSFIGFTTKEVKVENRSTINVSLDENTADLEEVIVTGNFDPRTRMNASVAISSLSTKQLARIVPNSAADLLKNLPGVYVNSSRGEVNNEVYTRGLNFNGSFYYVSMQEDGLPVMGVSGLVSPDGYLRADINVAKVEAVRGGTASILGPNAPGGIFNYISKEGGEEFEAEIRGRFGLEGNVKNPFYRTEVNIGGPLSKDKTITYNVGGFYRNADGAKYPGYTLSFGGQVKGNVVKKYKKGFIKLYAKYLNDNTSPFEFTPSVDFANPRPAGNFTNTSSTLVQSLQFNVPAAVNFAGRDINYDTRQGLSFNEVAFGLSLSHDLGAGWQFANSFRLSNKENIQQTTAVVFPFRVDQGTFYGVGGNGGRFGTFEFINANTGQSYGTVVRRPGAPIVPGNLSLPGGEVLPNGLLYNPNPYSEFNLDDIINQATVTKRLKNMTFTGGFYYSNSKINAYRLIPAAQTFATIEDKPQTVRIKYTNLGGQAFDLTTPEGISNVGGSGAYNNDATINQAAIFIGHNWDINSKLNFDWGIRAENFSIKSSFTTPRRLADSPTGLDGNASTLYDVRQFASNPAKSFEKSLGLKDVISYSAGLNYRVSQSLAIYGRYSNGRKTPDLSYFASIANQELTSNLSIEAQDIRMAEIGIKLKKGNFNLFATPFYSLAANIPNLQTFQNPDVTYYAPPRVYQKIATTGIELEGNVKFNDNFNLRAVGVIQNSVAEDFKVYLAKTNGPQDDELVVFDGGTNSNVGNMFTVTPSYNKGKFTAAIDWQYMGKRWANVGNAFQLPSFNSFDLHLGYNINKHMNLSVAVNNILDTYGIMDWAAPGGFPASLDTQGFTTAMLEANRNAVYSTRSIMPRSLFVTFSYKL